MLILWELTLDIESQACQVLPRICPTSKTTVHRGTAAVAISTEPTHNSNCLWEDKFFLHSSARSRVCGKS